MGMNYHPLGIYWFFKWFVHKGICRNKEFSWNQTGLYNDNIHNRLFMDINNLVPLQGMVNIALVFIIENISNCNIIFIWASTVLLPGSGSLTYKIGEKNH